MELDGRISYDSVQRMSRATKTAIWLIPWFPTALIAFTAIMSVLGAQNTHTMHIWLEPDGSSQSETDFTSLELQLIAVARIVLPLSLVAFIAGIAVLITVVVRRRKGQRISPQRTVN